jgi:nicotinamidase-related amidase
MRLSRTDTAVVLVDFQERFKGAVEGFDEAAERARVLGAGASVLGVPVVVTEQYPKGLGKTVTSVSDAIPRFSSIEKSVFSAAKAEGFSVEGRSTVVVCGVEAHVCVAQTVLDLIESGLDVCVAVDATASRKSIDRSTALERMRSNGAELTTVEAVLFELLGGAGDPNFKEVQGLIK